MVRRAAFYTRRAAAVVLMVLLLTVCSDAFLLPGGSKGPGAVARVSQSIRQLDHGDPCVLGMM